MQTYTHSLPHTKRLSKAIKSAKGQTAGLSVCVCMCVYVCMYVTTSVRVCVPGGRAVHVAHTGTDQRRRIIFGHVCTSSSPHTPTIIEHNKNQQIRRQRLMWTDKSRKWIWKPPPALCHISLHSVADKQDASPFLFDRPLRSLFPSSLLHNYLTCAGN